jgi:phthalate 3,4-dioxygenase subunit alpha
MGLTADDRPLTQPVADFAGPGVARVGYGEHNQRSWLALWSRHLADDARARPVAISGRAQEVQAR